MTATLYIQYLYDPLCGWCYGAARNIQTLLSLPTVVAELSPTGLFAGKSAKKMDDALAEFAWSNDKRIAEMTGQSFSEAYRRNVLGDRKAPFDSANATLALTAVALTASHREFDALKAIQEMRYVDGGDITDLTALSDLLRALSLDAAAARIAAPDADLIAINKARTVAAMGTMINVGARGVPTLIAGNGDNRQLVSSRAVFASANALIEEVTALHR